MSDASDRAGHGHKQLRIGLAPSRCDVIKRTVPWPGPRLTVPIPEEEYASSGPEGQEYRNEPTSARYFSEPRGREGRGRSYVVVLTHARTFVRRYTSTGIYLYAYVRTYGRPPTTAFLEVVGVRLNFFFNIARDHWHEITGESVRAGARAHTHTSEKGNTFAVGRARSIQMLRNYRGGNESRGPGGSK